MAPAAFHQRSPSANLVYFWHANKCWMFMVETCECRTLHRDKGLHHLLSALRLPHAFVFPLTLGDNPRIQASNLTRKCIRLFFPKRKCFVFDQPTCDKALLRKLDTISEEQLDPMFQEQTRAFVSYIFTDSKIKTLREGIKVTGNREWFCLTHFCIE